MRLAKTLLFAACLLPAAWLAYAVASGGLGADPVEALAKQSGRWALRLLALTLAVTPLRRLTGWRGLLRVRRMLGLFCFFYALLHLATYLVLDLQLEWDELLADIVERPFISAGLTTFLLLLPLALTSTRGWQRRLGRRWQQLHRLVYAAALGALLHFFWAVKADLREPLLYAGVFALLLGYRAVARLHQAGASR